MDAPLVALSELSQITSPQQDSLAFLVNAVLFAAFMRLRGYSPASVPLVLAAVSGVAGRAVEEGTLYGSPGLLAAGSAGTVGITRCDNKHSELDPWSCRSTKL